MTIKQQGGVFGRNPTFNDVTVENNLTVGGTTTHNGTQNIVGQLNVDNIRLDGNSVTSTNANGNLIIDPDGSGKIGLNYGAPKADAHLNGHQFVGGSSAGLELSDTSLYISRAVSASLARAVELTYTYNSGYVGAVFRRVDTSALSALPSTGSVTSDILSMDALTNNVIVSNGNLVIGTSGAGIDFSATSGTGTSELFNDYEEGTFSPVFADAVSGGNLASTSNTYAQYTKVGNVVHCTISMLNINTTGLTAGNTAYIQGLPFATVSAGASRFFPIYVRADGISSTVGIQGWILANAVTYIGLENVTTTGKANLLVSAISSGVSDLAVSFSYFTS
jgi:hypothetical protein